MSKAKFPRLNQAKLTAYSAVSMFVEPGSSLPLVAEYIVNTTSSQRLVDPAVKNQTKAP